MTIEQIARAKLKSGSSFLDWRCLIKISTRGSWNLVEVEKNPVKLEFLQVVRHVEVAGFDDAREKNF